MNALHSYQHVGARFLAERNVAFLLDTMGLGKTIQAIRGADLVGARRILVLCPAIARIGWAREFQAWQTTDRSIAVVRSGSDLQKQDVIGADVLLVSYTMLASEKSRRALLTRRNQVLICDEAHSLKEPKAVRTRAVYGSRINRATGLAALADRVWLLTGTLFPNHPAEVWTHLAALLPAQLEEVVGSRRKADFIERFCVTTEDGRIVGGKRIDELTAILRPHALRRTLDDVALELPPLTWSNVTIEPDKLPPKPEMAPEELAVVESARSKILDGESLTAADLMHISTLKRWVGVAKAPAVADLLSQETEPTVVFAVHSAVIDTLAASLLRGECAVIDGRTPVNARQDAIDNFQAGKVRVLICQMAIASTALTLTAAAHVVFAESSWTPSDMAQAATRCHRIRQTRPVLCRVVSLAGSLDEIVNAVIVRKMSVISQIDSEIRTPAMQE